MIATATRPNPFRDEFRSFFATARVPRRRSLLNFAEQEIVLPSGPFEGRKFSADRQPFARYFLEAVDSNLWNEIVVVGPSQSGKTLLGSVMPVAYHLFECQETVVYGVPDLEMAGDKWQEDLLPVIERTRYRDLLPRSGDGSRGGTPVSIRFGNGATLRFMTGGGGDKSRAGFTARVLVITEVDGFDDQGETSREGTKIAQLEARTEAFGARKRIYKECTASTLKGHIWQKWLAGSASRLALPCPHCHEHVAPEADAERSLFLGYEDADDEHQAAEQGAFHCPHCGQAWSDDDRARANRGALLLHRGQRIEQGVIVGDRPRTDTLGFRWSALHNLLLPQSTLAKKEFNALRAVDDHVADLALRQFTWALPALPSELELVQLNSHSLVNRRGPWPRGEVPAGAIALTIGVDLGKFLGHFVVIAWLPGATGAIVDYGTFEVPSDSMPIDQALMYALQTFRDEVCQPGFVWEGHAERRVPDQVWIDSGYQGRADGVRPVYLFVHESGDLNHNRYRACKGYGELDGRQVRYTRPEKLTTTVRYIGDNYHFTLDQAAGVYRVDVNADAWKSVLHHALARKAVAEAPSGPGASIVAAAGLIYPPGSIVLCRVSPKEHTTFARQLTAEQQIEKTNNEGRTVTVWVNPKRRKNHYLDATYLATAARDHCEVKTIVATTAADPRPAVEVEHVPLTLPDGRAFLVTER